MPSHHHHHVLFLGALLGVTACTDDAQSNDDALGEGSTSAADDAPVDDDGDANDDASGASTDGGSDDATTEGGETDAGLDDGDDASTGDPADAQRFRVTIHNVAAYFNAIAFSERDDGQTGPLMQPGQSYRTEFLAYPGSYLSFASMSAATNDWFFAPTGKGVPLFEDGKPRTADITADVRLYDLGTEEEDPSTIATLGGADIGEADDDPNVRTITQDVSASLTAQLVYVGTDDNGAYRFALELIREGDDILTPGLLTVHNTETPLFLNGHPDFGFGLERIAEDGNPAPLATWFNETSDGGAPLRLSSSITPLSPGVAYAFPDDGPDPLFTQGEPATEASGLETLAEDGDTAAMASFFEAQGLAYAVSSGGPATPGGVLEFEIEAVPGDNLGFATMFVQSNDWFLAFNNDGVPLFDDQGNPRSGVADSVQAYLWDAGTEADEPVGFGTYQVLRQTDVDEGPADPDPSVRRVSELDDVQFGKGAIASAPGVVAIGDERGGYNLLLVELAPL